MVKSKTCGFYPNYKQRWGGGSKEAVGSAEANRREDQLFSSQDDVGFGCKRSGTALKQEDDWTRPVVCTGHLSRRLASMKMDSYEGLNMRRLLAQ